jgi:uncharacterized protein with HEPN domain
MPPEKKLDAAFLLDMLNSARVVLRYVQGRVRGDLDRDEMLRDALERRIEVIGEAARGVSTAFRDAHPEVPWKKITATRHILAHDYGEVNHDILWRIATIHIKELVGQIEPLIPPIPPDPEPSEG